ncbi:MAG: TRAM domain-containing protein, partial [Clostridia bacterium]|nr:TRAM domain-containing protein [Clostridia bacterium]
MEQNTIYTLPVLDMNSEGTGICKQDSMVIFVPQTVTGDTVRLKIRNVQKNYAIAECLEIPNPSEYRREPE